MELIWLIVMIIIFINGVKKQNKKRDSREVPNQQIRPSMPNQQARPSMPNQQTRPSMPNQQARPSMPNQQARPSMPNQQTRPSVPNQRAAGKVYEKDWAMAQQKQRELKARLQQRYGQASGRGSYRTDSSSRQDDIFSRSVANVQENRADKLEMQMERERNTGNEDYAVGRSAEGRGIVPDSGTPSERGTVSNSSNVSEIGTMPDIGIGSDALGFVSTYSLTTVLDTEHDSELMRQVKDLMITGYQADIAFERDFEAEGRELLNRYV